VDDAAFTGDYQVVAFVVGLGGGGDGGRGTVGRHGEEWRHIPRPPVLRVRY